MELLGVLFCTCSQFTEVVVFVLGEAPRHLISCSVYCVYC